MQLPSLTTNTSQTGGLTTLSEKQVDLFLEYLRKQMESADESKRREKKEQAEQIQRDADKRQSDLQQTRLQMIADSRQSQDRRNQLDAIDDRKILRRQELDHKELDAELDHRLDQKHQDSAEYRLKEVDDTKPLEIECPEESLNLIGIARQAVKDSENYRPESITEIKTVEISSREESQNVVVKNDSSMLPVERDFAGYRLKGSEIKEVQEPANGKADAMKVDSMEVGKQMQMLASFSDLSAKLASTLKQPTSGGGSSGGASTKESTWSKGKNLRESPQYSEEGMELDSIPVEKRPRKMSPEFFEALDTALGSKGRKKSEPQEHGKDDLQAQSMQAESQHGLTAKNASRKDRPMLDQMERVRLVQRVANACLSAVNQNGTIQIKLHPETLGSVAVKIRTKNKAMNIELEAETESAKSVLLENADDLKRRLEEHGMRIESFSVQVSRP